MTVKQLIETLSKLDPELRVVTRGYERGYDDIEWPVGKNSPDVISLALNINSKWYYGNHEMVSENHQYGPEVKIVKAIIL
jgi:hypothetical protein